MSNITKEQLKIDRISPSALQCYIDCPRLFYYRYWLGLQLPDQEKRHLQFGTAFHAALENIYNQYDDNFGAGWEYAEVGIAIDSFKEQFKLHHITDEEFKKVLLLKSNKAKTREELFEMMEENGIQMVREYWKQKEFLLTEYKIDITEAEIPMKLEMINPDNKDDKLPIPLSMRLDARTRNKEKVVEFKTSSGEYDLDETRKKIQGRCYAYGHYLTEGIVPEVIYVVNLKDKRKIQVIPLKFDEADMSITYHEIETILQRIANREFPRTNSFGFVRKELEAYENALGIGFNN